MTSDALFDAPRRKAPPGGPVYQGVSAQLRAIFPRDDADAQARKAELSGWWTLALAHARAIDSAPGPSVGRAQTSTELRETLTYLAEAMSSGDSFDRLLDELGKLDTPAPAP